jgi:hypothetical protein
MIKERPKIHKILYDSSTRSFHEFITTRSESQFGLGSKYLEAKISVHRPEAEILVTILAREHLDLPTYFLDHAGLSKK